MAPGPENLAPDLIRLLVGPGDTWVDARGEAEYTSLMAPGRSGEYRALLGYPAYI